MTHDSKPVTFRWLCPTCGTDHTFTESDLKKAREIAKGPIPALWCRVCGSDQTIPDLATEIAAWERERKGP